MADISDSELLKLIMVEDDKLLSAGLPPKGRPLKIVGRVMNKLGFQNPVIFGSGASPLAKRISDIHESLYRTSDLAIGGMHGGIFMFRDVFARFYIPIFYGTVKIGPFQLTDLTTNQLIWLGQRPRDLQMFIDQFIDVFDFAMGTANKEDSKLPSPEARDIFLLSAFQLQAAAATLSMAFDFRGAVQSAILGAELALRGGLAAIGLDEAERIRHGHNLASAASAFAAVKPRFDLARVTAVTTRMPHFVQNRYSATQPSRTEVGHIAMGAQYIAGEVMLQVRGVSIRSSIPQAGVRSYPASPEVPPQKS